MTTDSCAWFDISEFGVEGKGWTDTKSFYDRFPARAEGVVREAVWNLSRAPSGMSVRFETDATTIRARWKLRSAALGMVHFPATGHSGLDLYARDGAGRWRWAGAAKQITSQQPENPLIEGADGTRREFMLYLPLFNPVDKVEIGIPKEASLTPLAPRKEKAIVFYGTSIVHGGCASRPGMSHPAILGRRLDRPIINLGFSGNGKMEPEVAGLLAELDPRLYVLDALPNMVEAEVNERAEHFVRTLRAAHPDTPIVLVEDRTYTDAWIAPAKRKRNDSSRAAYRAAYERLLRSGVRGLHYVEGETLFGTDDEATMDSSHPSDLGFMRMADALEPILRKLMP
ncbi:MAG: SGNH/GDSL hydrolase family protein [Planctomycetota bacterium]